MALFRPTGGCLGSCDGCCARGLDTGRPSSAYSVTILATLLPLYLTLSPRHGMTDRDREKAEVGRWVAYPLGNRHFCAPSQNKIKDSCQMLYRAHYSRARKWHYQWWSQRFVATGELRLSFISISSPRRLCLFNWQS